MDRENSSQRLESYTSEFTRHPVRTIARLLLEPGYTIRKAIWLTDTGEKRTDLLMRVVPFELIKIAALFTPAYKAVNNYYNL